MPLPDDFAAESLYGPEAWFIHDLVEVDVDGRRIVGSLDTTRIGWLVDQHQEIAGHERHLPGAVAVQMTGTLAQLLAIYVLGMRTTEGWFGYGSHVHQAKFPSLGRVGPPVLAECKVLRMRDLRGTRFIRYAYRYTQEGREVYVSEQSAAWLRREAEAG